MHGRLVAVDRDVAVHDRPTRSKVLAANRELLAAGRWVWLNRADRGRAEGRGRRRGGCRGAGIGRRRACGIGGARRVGRTGSLTGARVVGRARGGGRGRRPRWLGSVGCLARRARSRRAGWSPRRGGRRRGAVTAGRRARIGRRPRRLIAVRAGQRVADQRHDAGTRGHRGIGVGEHEAEGLLAGPSRHHQGLPEVQAAHELVLGR
jgi:hypothetical protein